MSSTASRARMALRDRRNTTSCSFSGGDAGRAEAPRAALCLRQCIDLFEMGARHRRDDELCDAIAPRDAKRLAPVIDEDDLHLAAIVGVDGAGGVEHGDRVL